MSSPWRFPVDRHGRPIPIPGLAYTPPRSHANGFGRVGFGDLSFNDLTTGPNADKDFTNAWQGVQTQLVAEGNSVSGDLITSAKGTMADAFNQIGRSWGVQDISGAASQYTLAAKSLLGSVTMVQGLLDSVQTQPPAQTIQMFTGVLVSAAIAAGLSAGVGAAIIAGVSAIAEVLRASGIAPDLFTGAPADPDVCNSPFPYFSPGGGQSAPPFYQIGCMGYILTPAGPYAQGDGRSGKNPLWMDFPDYTDPADAMWFQIRTGTTFWKRGSFASAYGPRLVDAAWPQYRHIECEAGNPSQAAAYPSHFYPGVPGDFQRAYFSAWKLNAALAINGQKSATDAQVLAQLLRLWNGPSDAPHNGSHSNSATFSFTPGTLMSNVGPAPCANVVGYGPYIGTLIGELQAAGSPYVIGGKLIINAGPAKTVVDTTQSGSPLHVGNCSLYGTCTPKAASVSTSSKIVTGVAVAGALGAGAVALYAAVNKMAFQQAAGSIWKKAKGSFQHGGARENPIRPIIETKGGGEWRGVEFHEKVRTPWYPRSMVRTDLINRRIATILRRVADARAKYNQEDWAVFAQNYAHPLTRDGEWVVVHFATS